MKKILVIFCLLTFSLFLNQQHLYAEVLAPEMYLFEDIPMVISSIGREQDMREVSHSMSVITSEQIRRSGAKNMADLLVRLPGFQVKNNSGFSTKIGIREENHLLANKILVLLDGVVVFNPAYSFTLWNALPIALDEIDRIEVIRGPGGVLYTVNAVNGVVNIISKCAEDFDSYSKVRAGTLHMGESSTGVKLYDENGLAVRSSYFYDTMNGFSEEYTIANRKTYLRRHIIGAHTDYNIGDDAHLKIFARYSTIKEKNLVHINGYYEHHYSMGVYGLQFMDKVNESYDYRFQLGMNEQAATIISSTNDLRVRHLNAQWQNNFRFDFFGDNLLSLGVDLTRNICHASKNMLNNIEQTQGIVSFFINDEYKPHEKWIISLGTRIDNNSNVPDNYYNWLLSPRFAAIYLPDQKHKFRFSLSRAYRTHSFVEKDANAHVGGGIYAIGNDDLEPEKVTEVELGYTGLFLDNNFTFDSVLFYMHNKGTAGNKDLSMMTFTIDYDNLGVLEVWGAEFTGKYFLTDDFNVYSDLSLTQSSYRYDNADNHVLQANSYNMSDVMLGLGTSYTKNKWKYNLYFKYVGGIKRAQSSVTLAAGTKVNGFYKSYARVAYSFSLLDKDLDDAEIEFVLRDFINKRDYEEEDKFFREPLVYLGLRVDF